MPRRANRQLAVMIALAAGVAAAGAGFAQERPESILPPGFGDPVPPPPAAAPQAAPTGSTAPRSPSPDLTRLEDSIARSILAEDQPAPVVILPIEYPQDRRRDPSQVGLFNPQTLGITGSPWGSSSGKFLSVLLRRNDGRSVSRWAQIGLRNMLLTKVAAPGQVNPADWVAERAWLLLRLGEADAARILVAGIDTDRFTPKLVQVAAQVALANSDPSGLCAIETKLSKVEPRVAPLVTAMCASLAGEAERAAADIEAARRRGRVGAIDLALADKVVGAGADTARAVTIEWEPVNYLNIWRYGLATATGVMPPDRLIDKAHPQVRAWLARAPMFAPAQKLKAARTAAAMGVMSSDAMVDLYAVIYDSTDPDELGGSDPWRLRQAFVGADREARMKALRQLWDDGGNRERQVAGWVTTARAATLIAPDAKLESDAANLIAAMFAGGYDRQAARWGPVVVSLDEADDAWAMLALGVADPSGLGIDQGRIEDFADRDESVGKQRTALLIAGLAGLGRIDPQVAGRLNQRYRLGLDRTTLWTRLIDGAALRRQAGTAMILAASGLQAPSIRMVPALYLFHATTALRRTGQEALARMIAAEALART